tara:strand:- start:332 stop:448 length:117 start_codon:yes stop_codon:yes gene_type:complete
MIPSGEKDLKFFMGVIPAPTKKTFLFIRKELASLRKIK